MALPKKLPSLKWCNACCTWPRPQLPTRRMPWRWPSLTRRSKAATDCPRPSGSKSMINFLHGKLVESTPTHVTVDVNGVGYEALIPLSSFDKLPPLGGEVKLLTHLAIRDDAHVLYGFLAVQEREMFRLLINTVSGIGPKIALNVLSGMNVTALSGTVANGDIKSLSQISGVGKKTAERIGVEVKDKIGPAGAWEASSARGALSAL